MSVIERALELAREGRCRTVEEITRKLKEERHSHVDSFLSPSIRKQLRAEIAKARQPTGEPTS